MLKTCRIENERIVEDGGSACPIEVYVNPDENEKRRLIEDYRIDEHTLASALDPDELSRLEFEPEHIAIIFKQPKNYSAQDRLLFKVGSTGAFLFPEKLIIVQSLDLPLFEGRQFLRVSSLPEIVLKLIYNSIFHFLEHMKVINRMVDELEQKISAAMENRYLLQLFQLQKSLVFYYNSIASNGSLIDKLKLNANRIGFNPVELEFLDDITIENGQCVKQAEISSSIMANLMDARVSIVSNNLNVLMKTLNIITIAIMVPTMVVSIFSMNVRLPFFDQNHPGSFWAIMGLALLSVVVFLFFWRRRRW